MIGKMICLLLMTSPGNGFLSVNMPNKHTDLMRDVKIPNRQPAFFLEESKSGDIFELPETPEEAIEEYRKKPLADPNKVNEKLIEIGSEVLADPEVQALLKDAGLTLDKLYDTFGFAGLALSAICEPNFGPVGRFEVGASYKNRPTLLLIDKLHSVGIRFAIKDDLFTSIQEYLKVHKDEIAQELQAAVKQGEPLAELIYRIFTNFITAKDFNEMIDNIGDDVNKLKRPINKWIDEKTDELTDNNGVFTALAVFLRKLTTGFDIRINKPGFFRDEGEVYLSVNGNIVVANGRAWLSWKPNSIDGEVSISTRSGITGMLLNQMDPSGREDSADFKGIKEMVLLIPSYIENMTAEQQAEVTKGVKELFLNIGEQLKEELESDADAGAVADVDADVDADAAS